MFSDEKIKLSTVLAVICVSLSIFTTNISMAQASPLSNKITNNSMKPLIKKNRKTSATTLNRIEETIKSKSENKKNVKPKSKLSKNQPKSTTTTLKNSPIKEKTQSYSKPKINAISTNTSVTNEIFKLVNEYRSNPYGRLARKKPLPKQCNSITNLRKLEFDNRVSDNLSQIWTNKLSRENTMYHRSIEEQKYILLSLHIRFNYWGENVGWNSGYRKKYNNDLKKIAQVFFEGWRESDSHFCNMVSKKFTHVGIGHKYDSSTGKDWAVQNFYGAK